MWNRFKVFLIFFRKSKNLIDFNENKTTHNKYTFTNSSLKFNEKVNFNLVRKRKLWKMNS
jgi:hypothetical protein